MESGCVFLLISHLRTSTSTRTDDHSGSIYTNYGLNEQETVGCDMDVVFVHGLRGGALITWRIKREFDIMDSNLTIWPRDWLAEEFPNVRIMSVEYDARITNWTGKTIPLEEQANNIAETLHKVRAEAFYFDQRIKFLPIGSM